jgi:hypothetical protein
MFRFLLRNLEITIRRVRAAVPREKDHKFVNFVDEFLGVSFQAMHEGNAFSFPHGLIFCLTSEAAGINSCRPRQNWYRTLKQVGDKHDQLISILQKRPA